MRSTRWTVSRSAMTVACLLCATVTLLADPPSESKKESNAQAKSDSKQKPDNAKRVSVEEARKRAKLSHNIYASTLDVIHHRYFRADRSTIPARAMQDVFADVARKESIKARWISVNARAMSIDHRPQDDFEKRAAKELSGTKDAFERVEQGMYRRAERISLNNGGCLGCHLGFGANGTQKRFAGLVISIPVTME
ncbi:MAG: DUF3365 domain-containing protein [Planctomycetaceae bacterium]|jgi:hypothetical protein|nr:DUF3365 domain-containing protein [Planctomycetaceae bacterium]MBT6483477.1 DUF3365 domain-containing protein [Planctomycetaceae bacterium]MBT6494712.1 DUF3365 domain-containing protein [Planctomycetaceae bacterium]